MRQIRNPSQSEIDYHVLRASMVLMFLFFGYQKWFEYEAQALIPYISNGPLIFWMYPVFGSEVLAGSSASRNGSFGALLFWDSGTRRREFLARSAESLRSCPPQRSFLLSGRLGCVCRRLSRNDGERAPS